MCLSMRCSVRLFLQLLVGWLMSYCIFYIFVYFAYSDVQYFVLSIIFTSVFRDVRNGFRMQIFFYSSLPPDVCRRAHVLFTLFAFVCVLWCPTCIVLFFAWFVFVLFLACSIMPVSMDCLFLVAPSGFSNIY